MASVTNTYARAFADVVLDQKLDVTRVTGELRSVQNAVEGSSELRRVWENPSIPAAQKRSVLDAIVAEEGISRPVRNFIAVMIDKRRIALLADVIREFELDINHRLGFADAAITTARDLGDAEKRELESQVARLTGKQVKARYLRDAAILGGAVVRIGSTIYDGSVLGQLQRVREKILAGS